MAHFYNNLALKMSVLQEITEIRSDAFYASQAQKLDMIFKKNN